MGGFFKDLGSFLAKEGINKTVDNIKKKVDTTISDVEKKIEIITVKVIKTSILFLMMVTGGLFMLVGLAQYLNETISTLGHGLGTVLVGAILIVLALFVRIMK